MTMRKQAEGVLTRYLFGKSWDQHMSNPRSYNVPIDDNKAIDFALNNGLPNQLPRVIQFLEYGAGGKAGVIKPKLFIKKLIDKGLTVSSYVAIDTEERYVRESSIAIAEEFNGNSPDTPQIQTHAIVGDFMSRSRIDIPPPEPSAVPVIGVFGCTLSNAPDYSMSGGKDSQQNCAEYIEMMKERALNGVTEDCYLLMTYHEENDRNRLLEQYAATEEFIAFVLGSFPQVLKHGIITDRDYHFKDYWTINPFYDDKNHVVKLYAKCHKEHVIPTIEGDIPIGVGEQFAHILSHKWGKDVYRAICGDQGDSEITFYQDPNKHTGVMLAHFWLPSLKR
jgi:Histidine-specific methyltransferase, SAM-dependent